MTMNPPTNRHRRARRLLRAALAAGIAATLTAVAPTAAGATPRPSISTSSADMFWCTSTQAFCAGPLTQGIPYGTPLTMVCWRDDRQPFPGSSPRWFYSYLDNGQEGWLWAPQVANQVTTPSCSALNWINVGDFSIGHIGQVNASPAEAAQFSAGDWAPGPVGEWSGDCVKFTYLAWGKATATGNAIDVYHYYANRGMVRTSRPPRGALVFWNLTSLGHIAISIGNWMAVGTQGLDNQFQPISAYGILDPSRGPAYLGWAMPQPPTVPQNPS
jgi:hypothetical protein